MAYVTICEPCQRGAHDQCEVSLSEKLGGTVNVGFGGWFCVCAHGGEENDFQRSVREGVEKTGAPVPMDELRKENANASDH